MSSSQPRKPTDAEKLLFKEGSHLYLYWSEVGNKWETYNYRGPGYTYLCTYKGDLHKNTAGHWFFQPVWEPVGLLVQVGLFDGY